MTDTGSKTPWRALAPLLLSAAVLLAGNAMLVTVIALRGQSEGFSDTWIGIFGGAYFVGYLIATWFAVHLIRIAGHIRVFAGLAAVASVATLCMLLWINVEMWITARVVQGFAFSGVATVIESWMNGMIANRNRGRILSIYRVIDLAGVTGGQFLLPVIGIDDHRIFVVCALFFAGALIPVTLSDLSNPATPRRMRFDIAGVWAISPAACVGVVTVGMANNAFRSMGPSYAASGGMDTAQVAAFMSVFIVAGAVSQFPLGWLSDRLERRLVIVLAAVAAAIASLFIMIAGDIHPLVVFAGVAFFGGAALPLYSLASAHANDHCPKDRFVTLAAVLLLFYAAGAAIGAPLAALLMDLFGPSALFAFVGGAHGAYLLYVLYRKSRRSGISHGAKSKFVGLMRTSPTPLSMTQQGGKSQGASQGASQNASQGETKD